MPVPRLIAAVYVKDPSTREELILLPGECPAPEIAALVTNPEAWDAPLHDEAEEAEPQPVAVGEPHPTAAVAEPDQEQGEAGGKRTSSRRTRSSST
ncbi:hypothetical protein [Streptomyces sp. BP-8]|uniref:Uncharacterized protein n=1 Tax=Streptomyces sirii TaxID=3127701 RepID=A0ABZ2QKL7_9ACTN